MQIDTPVAVFDGSITLNGSAQTVLAYDAYRAFLLIQAPNGHAVTLSFTNPSPVAGATGCFTLAAAGAPVIFGPNVPKNTLYATGTNADVLCVIWGNPG